VEEEKEAATWRPPQARLLRIICFSLQRESIRRGNESPIHKTISVVFGDLKPFIDQLTAARNSTVLSIDEIITVLEIGNEELIAGTRNTRAVVAIWDSETSSP
jgi:hypothetical protein